MDASGPSPGGGRSDDIGQRGSGAASGTCDRRRTQIGPQWIRCPAHDERPAHALERGRQRARTDVRCAPVPHLLGLPQQLGHFLEAVRPRQVGGGLAPVDRAAALVELGHPGRDGGEARGRLPSAPAADRQRLNGVQVEEAAPAGRIWVGLEHAPAHVRVQRRHLDAEPPCCLLGTEHAFHVPHLTLT